MTSTTKNGATKTPDWHDQPSIPRPFAAAHSGLCVSCENAFSEGELIIRATAGWAHAECPEEKSLGAVCPKCFTAAALNGECQC